jgi:type IV pilus assembly protein PilO
MTMDLNLDDLKKLSPLKKGLLVFVFCLLIGYFYYMYFLQGIIESQFTQRARLDEMQTQIAAKQKVAVQIGRYKKEVEQLNSAFSTALQKLPNQREIAGLLASVVLSGREAGVNFLLFEPTPPPKPVPEAKTATEKTAKKGEKPQPEAPQKFYDEIPVSVKLSGAFHNTVSFFAKVAELSRIINVEEIAIADAKPLNGGKMSVVTSCTMKTYKFVDRGKK